MNMKYIISEEQLKNIIESVEKDNTDGFKGIMTLAYMEIDLPFLSPKPTRDTHPHLFKTKYTSDGHPIPLKTPSISYVSLINPLTDYVYVIKYGDSAPSGITGILGPDKEFYIFTQCSRHSQETCLGHVDKSYVSSWTNANHIYNDEHLAQMESEFLSIFEHKGKIIELKLVEETT